MCVQPGEGSSSISNGDAAVLVSGLSKKDSTTKYKSLIGLDKLIAEEHNAACSGDAKVWARVVSISDFVIVCIFIFST